MHKVPVCDNFETVKFALANSVFDDCDDDVTGAGPANIGRFEFGVFLNELMNEVGGLLALRTSTDLINRS